MGAPPCTRLPRTASSRSSRKSRTVPPIGNPAGRDRDGRPPGSRRTRPRLRRMPTPLRIRATTLPRTSTPGDGMSCARQRCGRKGTVLASGGGGRKRCGPCCANLVIFRMVVSCASATDGSCGGERHVHPIAQAAAMSAQRPPQVAHRIH
jgi:hypothetical protein